MDPIIAGIAISIMVIAALITLAYWLGRSRVDVEQSRQTADTVTKVNHETRAVEDDISHATDDDLRNRLRSKGHK